jgi:serine/threonine protein phosphatase 1
MKYFVTSDIHGHYEVLINSLKRKGFDEMNKDHHLLILGDMFDRGKQSREVFDYLYRLHKEEKATILLGNHDYFMIEFLEGNEQRALFNILHNGFLETLTSFTQSKLIFKNNLIDYKEKIEQQYPYLLSWLKSLPLYLEIGNYIFVHGGINPNLKDWRKALRDEFIWGYEFMQDRVLGKTVVAGHQRVVTIREPNRRDYIKIHQEDPTKFDPIYLEGKILIDRFVEVSKELNVLIFDL